MVSFIKEKWGRVMGHHPMDTLGFRPPQFSEDLAWVPGWLQQHQIEQLDECIKELKGNPEELECKDLEAFEGKYSKDNYADTLSREEDGNKSYRLFLSGEDNNTPADYASSPGNVLHFHLRLSSTGFTQCSPTQPPDASEKILKSNRVASVELHDTSLGLKDKTSSEMELHLGGRNVLPLNSIQKSMEDVGPRCPSKDNKSISETYIREKYNVKYLKATDMTAAAELSIAASEAMVIHEIVRRGTIVNVLPTEVVLEAALRVKKARLEWSVDALDSLGEETDESDTLSDLDDLTMADVYEDVGLSHSIPSDNCTCDSAISLVKETPLSEKQHESANLCDPVELGAQQLKLNDMSARGQLSEKMDMDILKDNVTTESFNHEREEFSDNLVPDLNMSNVPKYYHSALKVSNVFTRKQQTIDPTMVDVTFYQPKKEIDIHPHAWNSANSREDRVSYLVPGRFRSRWLGGWTGHEVSVIGHVGQNTRKIASCFADETSYLSESADIAPDMNSFVQVHETESQSSIHFDLLPSESNKRILLSQDVVRSSSLSLVDPLCSVVPCSIPSENEVSVSAQTQRDQDKESHTEIFFNPTTELGMGNSHKTSNLVIECHHEDAQATPATDSENSPVSVRRQFISLKTYSTLLPNPVSSRVSLSQSIKLDQITSDQNEGCNRSSDKCRKVPPPFKLIPENLSGDYMESGKLISNGTPEKRKYNQTTGDGNTVTVQASKKRRQLVSFNHRAHRHLRTSKSFHNNSTREKHPKLTIVAEDVVELQQNKKFQSILSERRNVHDRGVPARKRVHFSEAEIRVQQMKNPKILDFSTKHCLTDRASKKPKYSNNSNFQNHEKCWHTNSDVMAGKRLLFQGIQFLLTGFSRQKEKHLEGQIWKHGGNVLFDIPSPHSRENRCLKTNAYQLPIILCPKKLQTTKFLYGCAVNAFILKDDWLTNSISADHIVPPEHYIILRNVTAAKHINTGEPFCYSRDSVFYRVGIMLHGKQSFCSKLAKIIKHAGGQVYKTLQRLMLDLGKEKFTWGAIVSENEKTSRHLRHCAAEQRIPILPASWIVKSLQLGKRLPFSDTGHSSSSVLSISGPTFP